MFEFELNKCLDTSLVSLNAQPGLVLGYQVLNLRFSLSLSVILIIALSQSHANCQLAKITS